MNLYTLLLEGNGHKTKRVAYLFYYHPVGVKAHGLIQFQVDVREVPTDPAAAKQLVKTAVAILRGPAPAMAANLSAHLSAKVTLPVNVRTLNTAPISLRLYVLRGECLFSRDDNLRTDIMEDTMRRYLNIAPLHRHATKETFGYSESHDLSGGSLRTNDED